MRNITNIPAPRVAFIDERTGLMSREWYRFFLNLFVLTGSGQSDVTIEDLQKAPVLDVVMPVEDVIPITNVVMDNTETQLATLTAKYDEISNLLQDLQLSVPAPGSTGTVSKVSVATANGFSGTVANPTTTPEITISTTETGLLGGNGTAIGAAVIGTGLQYASNTLSINATTGTEILRGNGSGQFSNITVGTGLNYASNTLSVKGLTGGTAIQYENGAAGFAPVTIGTGLSFSGGTLSTTGSGTGTVTNVSVVSANGLAGTVTNPTTTPAITLSTTANGVLGGNGTSIGAITIGTGLQYASNTLSSTINGTFQGVYNASVGSAFATMMTIGDGNKPFRVAGPTTSVANVGGKGQNFQQINYMTGTASQGGAGIYAQIDCNSYGFINPIVADSALPSYDYAAVVGVAARGTTGTVNNSLLGGLFQTWISSFVAGTQVTAAEFDCSNEGGYGGLGRAYAECGIGAYINTASTYSPYAGVQIRKLGGAGWYNGILLNDITNHAISVGTAAQSSNNTPVFSVTGTGTAQWGSGSAAPDVTLSRSGAATLAVGGTLSATAFSGPLTGNVTGNVSGSSGSCTGNAATATQLQTARNIQGVSFNGTADISIPSITYIANTYQLRGANTVSGTNAANFSGLLPTGSATSTNQWLELRIDSTSFWVPIWVK